MYKLLLRGGNMNTIRKRLLAAFLSFVMVFLSMSDLFTAYAGPPGIVNDPDIIAEVTYDRSVVNSRGNSDFYVGEEVSFYANITVSSITRSIPGAYGKLYLPKKIFTYINANNISTWINRPSTNYLNIDSTSDSEYHIVTLKFNNLGGGTTQTVPFKGKIADFSLANNESYVIPYQVYDANDTLLESNNNTFTAKTYPIGYGNEDYNYRRSYQYVQGSSDLQSDNSLSNTLSTYVDFYTRRTNWPAPGTYHGTSFPQVGADRRKTRVTVQLPANENFDTTDSRNAGWTYDPVNHTISKEKNYPSNTYTSEGFYIRYNNQPTGTINSPVEVTFPIKWEYVNDDGTTDPASLEKPKAFARYASFPAIPPTDRGVTAYKSASPWYLTFDDREESTVHKYDISTAWGWNTGTPVTYPTLGQKKGRLFSILDTPEVDMEFMGYQIKYPNLTGKVVDASGTEQTIPVLDATQKAALSNNQLIGTKPDGSEEVIATNVSITENSTMIDLPNPTHYTKINLKFTNPIEIQAPNGNVVVATYKFRLAESSYNNVKTILDAKPDDEQSYYDTYNRANVYGDDGASRQWNAQTRQMIRWAKIYAKESAHTTQNQNLGTKYLNEEFQMTDGIQPS